MKKIILYILFGIVQGVTEAMPISSSGHMLILQNILTKFNFLDADFPINSLSVFANFGSLIAVVIIFFSDIKELINYFFKYLRTKNKLYKEDYNYCWMVVLGCIPAGLVGLIVSKLDLLDSIKDNVHIIGISLIITSILLFIVRKKRGSKETVEAKEALTVGGFQMLGVFPGISRSGSTIVGGLLSGLKPDTAFKYSYILYIPLSLCALLLDVKDIFEDSAALSTFKTYLPYFGLSVLLAFVGTLLVLRWFRKIVNEGKIGLFSIYCFIVGLLVIILL